MADNKVFTRELVAETVGELNIADLENATIGEILLVASALERKTGIPFIRMDQGSPGLPPNKIGIEAEKERIRAERRAANPDGITTNTSKKKLQKQQRDQEAAAREAAAREYAARKGVQVEVQEESVMSGIPSRPYCKGRNYDPDRYVSQPTEE